MPLIYTQGQGGYNTTLWIQNSGDQCTSVEIYFVDHTGGIIATVVDWICPRGSQTFFLPVINGLPGNYVGAARIESQNWWTPGDPSIQAPNVLSVVNLVKYADQSSTTTPLEMAMYNALPEWKSFDWQGGKPLGLLGMGLLGVPLVSKGALNQIYSELAIQNLNPNPGFTDLAIFFYDQNGLLGVVCQKLNEKQVEYIDLASWGFVLNGFNGSVVISATRTTQPGGFGLAGVVGERVGRSLTQPQINGDETKAYEMFPMFFPFTFAGRGTPVCPGQP